MECGDYDGRYCSMARGPSAVGLQLNFSAERGVPLAIASRVPRKPARPVVLDPPPNTRDASHVLPTDAPFINEMDEISYWIHTKRAPCLMNYDNLIKKQNEEAQSSKTMTEEPLTPKKKKKKRKLSMLDEDTVSTEKQENIYFEICQKPYQPMLDGCESDSLGSDVDFNIKNTSMAEKPKKARIQKSSRTRIQKKNTVATSTPKATVHLRRSLRQAQQSSSNANLNNSLEIFDSVVSNGHFKNNSIQKPSDKVNKSTQMFAAGDQIIDSKRNANQKNKSKPIPDPNGQFEDLSDVSGFTANYIRSTKVQSNKVPRKLKCKSNRTLVKESQQNSQNDNMVVCVNKSMNTGVPKTNILNCSTDSSQNVINLVTSKSNDKSEKIDKSTSLLKFVDTRSKSKDTVAHKGDSKQKSKSNLNVSFQSQSSGTSRYPKRYKNHTDTNMDTAKINTRRRAASKNCIEFNNSDKKENPEDAVGARTRSGRNANLSVFQRENSVLVVSNSTEQVSSMVSLNVASPTLAEGRRKRRTTRQVRTRKSNNKSGQPLRRDSLRDKSGFTACFSESDDDSVPLVQRKYFCN